MSTNTKAFDWMPTVEKCCRFVRIHRAIKLILIHTAVMSISDLFDYMQPVCAESSSGIFSILMFFRILICLAMVATVFNIAYPFVLKNDIRARQIAIYCFLAYAGYVLVYELVYVMYFLLTTCTMSSCSGKSCSGIDEPRTKISLVLVMTWLLVAHCLASLYYAIVFNSYPYGVRPPPPPPPSPPRDPNQPKPGTHQEKPEKVPLKPGEGLQKPGTPGSIPQKPGISDPQNSSRVPEKLPSDSQKSASVPSKPSVQSKPSNQSRNKPI